MTDLVRRDQTDSWVDVLGAVGDLAGKISSTEFVPKSLRGRAPAVAAAILAGRERGLPPMVSLASIDVVDGRPTLSAQLLAALVYRAGHRITVIESTRQSRRSEDRTSRRPRRSHRPMDPRRRPESRPRRQIQLAEIRAANAVRPGPVRGRENGMPRRRTRPRRGSHGRPRPAPGPPHSGPTATPTRPGGPDAETDTEPHTYPPVTSSRTLTGRNRHRTGSRTTTRRTPHQRPADAQARRPHRPVGTAPRR